MHPSPHKISDASYRFPTVERRGDSEHVTRSIYFWRALELSNVSYGYYTKTRRFPKKKKGDVQISQYLLSNDGVMVAI